MEDYLRTLAQKRVVDDYAVCQVMYLVGTSTEMPRQSREGPGGSATRKKRRPLKRPTLHKKSWHSPAFLVEMGELFWGFFRI